MQPVYLRAIIFAFIFSLIFSPVYIAYSKRRQFRQRVRLDGPHRHYRKTGTPTTGGLIFLVSVIVTLLIFAPKNLDLLLPLFLMLSNAAIGFVDDYSKFANQRSLGLKARDKLAGQVVIAVIFTVLIMLGGHSTAVRLPFTATLLELGPFYPLLVFVMVSGTANAVNLTDGIDGLAGGASIIALLAFLIFALINRMTSLAYFNAALIGACFGFLIFNLHPARIFMGDVGSLALGGALAASAILTKTELLLAIVGGLFVIELLSVVLQVIYFRLTGRRIFRMSPLHHHFELKGWSEWHVVTGFWALAFVFAAVALLEFRLFGSL